MIVNKTRKPKQSGYESEMYRGLTVYPKYFTIRFPISYLDRLYNRLGSDRDQFEVKEIVRKAIIKYLEER